jgi:hypothetical protein
LRSDLARESIKKGEKGFIRIDAMQERPIDPAGMMGRKEAEKSKAIQRGVRVCTRSATRTILEGRQMTRRRRREESTSKKG